MVKTAETKKNQKKIFIQWLGSGVSISKAAQLSRFARSSAYKWRSEDKVFAEKWDDAIEDGSDKLEDEAFRRAVTGTDKPVGFYQGAASSIVKSYSDNLLIFLLKARRPSKFGDKIEATANDKAMEELSVEDKEIIARMSIK
jgi:hypothetical protein